jgi:acetone carboxylase gamma subunit
MHKCKIYEPHKIVTFDAERAIKASAQVKNESLFAEIKDLNLISKEFKVHTHCYREFTRKETEADEGKALKYDKGNFDAVIACVEEDIVRLWRVVSLQHLSELYELGIGDSRYRSKLKGRLHARLGDSITILSSASKRTPEVVISNACIDKFITCTPNETLEKAANILVKDTREKFMEIPELPWPPSTEELSKESWKPPASIYTFLKALFKHKEYIAILQPLKTDGLTHLHTILCME